MKRWCWKRGALLLGTVVALGAVGCATPAPLVRLDPVANADVIWVGGRAAIVQERSDVRVAAAFERKYGESLALRLEIEDRTATRFDVAPTDVTFTICAAGAGTPCTPPRAALDPEAALRTIDSAQSIATAAGKNQDAFNTTLTLLSATTDIASIAAGTAGHTTGLRTEATASLAADTAAARDRASTAREAERSLWANQALRRNTLMPGHGVAGLVLIPFDPAARLVDVIVASGGQRFIFAFRQTVERPVPPPGEISERRPHEPELR